MMDDAQTDEIRTDIEETRANMGQTVDELEARLTPEQLQDDATDIINAVTEQVMANLQEEGADLSEKISEQLQMAINSAASTKSEEVFEQISDSAMRLGTIIWERATENPASIALAAVGVGLAASGARRASHMISNDDDEDGYHYSQGAMDSMHSKADNAMDSLHSKAGNTMDSLHSKAGGAMETASNVAGHAQEMASGTVDEAKSLMHGMTFSGGMVQGFVQRKPLSAGLVALGLGAFVGMALPETSAEREAMASMRHEIKRPMTGMGMEGGPKEMMERAKEEMRDAANQAMRMASQSVEQFKQDSADVLTEAKNAAMEQARAEGLTR